MCLALAAINLTPAWDRPGRPGPSITAVWQSETSSYDPGVRTVVRWEDDAVIVERVGYTHSLAASSGRWHLTVPQ